MFHLAQELLTKAGIEGNATIHPISGGHNNRVFRVTVDAADYLLKSYYHGAKDPRDRLGHEFAFLSFANQYGIDAVPKPIVQDRENRLGLYEFIYGERITPESVGWPHVAQAMALVQALNGLLEKPGADALPAASEACFSLEDHISQISHRMARLATVEPGPSQVNHAAHDFINHQLLPVWESLRERTERRIKASQIDGNEPIPSIHRILSPSDFGFHNAILERDGRVRFIDFEYAGWDDPAKMVCDFFCQPAVPAPMVYLHAFSRGICPHQTMGQSLMARIRLLLPLHRLKWCGIILNEFMPEAINRRRFAHDAGNETHCKTKQLEKARRLLDGITMTSKP